MMIWLLITTFYSSILLFIALNPQVITSNNQQLLSHATANLCGGIGMVSLTISGVLWTTMYGWQYGLLALVATVIANFVLFFITSNRLNQVVAGATLLVGASFFVSTINMFMVRLV